jgi:uncharacterized protein (DUF1330 family)
VIGNIEVTDPERHVAYVQGVRASLAAYGGRFLVRGGAVEKLEGAIEPKRVVVIEFPSLERAKAWWDSAEYRDLKALRRSASIGSLMLAQGA